MEGKFSLAYPDTLKDRRIYLQAFGYKNKSVMINKNQTSVRIVLVDSMYNLQTVKA
ncbi:hypothetical protein FACS1894174_04790 [Bacteroidia bacterium]|nr:hypothetical protein FACS1894155_04440 [Bacteroidia bacterium]GHV21417.1 hypothetical protein FACS1894174_04790 [Bacteroidia bacterium]